MRSGRSIAEARSGESISCLPGRAEPRLDPGSMVTRQIRTRRLRYRGAKTGFQLPIADVFVVWAKTDDGIVAASSQRAWRAVGAEDRRQFQLAHLGYRRDRDGRGLCSRSATLARCRRPGRAVRMPEQRALRHRLGRAGRGRILLARGAAIHDGPIAVRPAAGREPADPEKARRHADRHHARPSGLSAARAPEGRREGGAGDHVDHEAQFLRQGAGHRAHGARHARRQWHRRRVPRDPSPAEPRDRQYLRGHARCACADPPRTDRHLGVQQARR